MGNGKPTKCPICKEKLPSGKALGGHMSRHKAAKRRRAETLAGKSFLEKADKALSGEASRVKAQNCKICGFPMKGGKAVGGHMSKHRLADRPEAAVESAMKAALTSDRHVIDVSRKAGNWTFDFGKTTNQTLKIVSSLHAASKGKRAAAAKLEVQAKQHREDANELDRLAERIEHLL